ncbi:MAG: hypothetical protein IT406_03475 [Candidatus Yanofskybacteria bacterium]|nr:hypothetical protein [Candidatus Yanofskybacteria bacterium]
MKAVTIRMPTMSQLRSMFLIGAAVLGAIFFLLPAAQRFVSVRAETLRGWQAVYLVNGDLYIGRIRSLDDRSLELKDAYYVSLGSNDGGPGQAASVKLQSGEFRTVSLVRWGFSQPLVSFGVLQIERSSVLFWESLSGDAEVVKQVEEARKKQ